MHGPPMSMFSIASASVTPGFATVCSNGYRLHTTRSISGSAVLGERLHVLRLVALREQAGVDRGVQRLHPAVEDFGEAGQLADVLHRQPGVGEGLPRAAGGDQLDAVLR